jgi:1-acyl-sn-glycerol-3-phosphate acyltransferase
MLFAVVPTSPAAWLWVTAIWMLPPIVLAPLIGAISNNLPKRWVLIASAAFCLAVVCLLPLLHEPWRICLVLVSVGVAVYGPTRYALLPAAADDTHIPLPRVNGWIEMGTAAAVAAAILILSGGSDLSIGTILALNLLGLLAAWPVWFAGDVQRCEKAGQALAGFFRAAAGILKLPETRTPLLFTAGFRGLVAALAGALFALQPVSYLLDAGLWAAAGLVLGSALAGIQGNLWRCHGLVPFGAAGLCIAFLAAALGAPLSGALGVFLGVMAALVHVPLSTAYQAGLPADARGNGMALRNMTDGISTAAFAALGYFLIHTGAWSGDGLFWFMALLAAAGTGLALWCFFRETMEFLVEIATWPMYRVHVHGPGLDCFPGTGPVLVISNHCCWFDPVFIAKIMPRRLTAMMTSQFYDRPLLHWFAQDVVHAIRVQAAAFRREAPELAQAVAELDAGEGVLIFPEGAMRRREQVPLKRFGQGIWHILNERPQTPVVVCWIEGNWGSYASYWNGSPTVNKRLDFWRPIHVAVGQPHRIPKEVLADHRETRQVLMRECLEARRYLGLEPLAPAQGVDEEPTGAEEKV